MASCHKNRDSPQASAASETPQSGLAWLLPFCYTPAAFLGEEMTMNGKWMFRLLMGVGVVCASVVSSGSRRAWGNVIASEERGCRPEQDIRADRGRRAVDDHGLQLLGRRGREAGPGVGLRIAEAIQAAGLYLPRPIRSGRSAGTRRRQVRQPAERVRSIQEVQGQQRQGEGQTSRTHRSGRVGGQLSVGRRCRSPEGRSRRSSTPRRNASK